MLIENRVNPFHYFVNEVLTTYLKYKLLRLAINQSFR